MMHFPTRRTVLGAASAVALLALTACGNVAAGSTSSAKFPSGPVNLTVGQAPGGSTDLIARAISEGASKTLGAPMPVVNKPGANGALATKEVAGKPADGQNLLLLNASLITITPLAVTPDEAVNIDDLDIIAGLSQDDYVLVASKTSGLKTIKDLTGRRTKHHLRHHGRWHRQPACADCALQAGRTFRARTFPSTAASRL